ncbi:unnamed protein product, partial [Ectocarpus sp. 13 AM-2016]
VGVRHHHGQRRVQARIYGRQLAGQVVGTSDVRPRHGRPSAVPPLRYRDSSAADRGLRGPPSPPHSGEEGGGRASGGHSGQPPPQLLYVPGVPQAARVHVQSGARGQAQARHHRRTGPLRPR